MNTIEFQVMSSEPLLTVESKYSFESLHLMMSLHGDVISYKGVQYLLKGCCSLPQKNLILVSLTPSNNHEINPMKLELYFTLDKKSNPESHRCSCGSESVGSEKHSSWCSINTVNIWAY